MSAMGSAVEFYDKLLAAEDDRSRARVIAEGFERLEERYPEVRELVTQTHLSETERRLQKEIEQIRREIEEIRRETEQIRRGTVETEGRLRLEIEQVRSSILRWLVGLMAGQTAVILAAIFAMVQA